MARFIYRAKNKMGNFAEGNIEADSLQQAIAKLHSLGYYPLKVEAITPSSIEQISFSFGRQKIKTPRFKRISTIEIANFTRQLADLLEAGIPLLRALNVLLEQTINPKLHAVIEQIRNDVQTGSSLAEALSKHPKIFNQLYVNMVKAGETGGLLEQTLARLADFAEKEVDLKGKILSALAYPIVLLVVGFLVVVLLMTLMIPRFVSMFTELEVALPVSTKLLISISNFFKNYWWLILLIFFTIGEMFRRLVKTAEGKNIFHSIQLRLPLLGPVIQKREIARFARTFGELLRNGVPMLQALAISSETVSNQLISNEIIKLRARIAEGERIANLMKDAQVFPPVVINMIAVGEESGNLENILLKIASSFESEVERATKTLTSLLEPAIILIMGVIVGFIVLSVLLPIFSINIGFAR